MSEANALKTTGEGTCAPVLGCPDAKREDGQALCSSAAPLSGRRSEGTLLTRHEAWKLAMDSGMPVEEMDLSVFPLTGERSVPDNA